VSEEALRAIEATEADTALASSVSSADAIGVRRACVTDLALRKRAAEVEAAHGFAALLEACQEEEMDAAEGEEAGAGMQIVGLAASYDTEMVT